MNGIRIIKYLTGIAGMALSDYGAFRLDPIYGYIVAGFYLFILVFVLHYLEEEMEEKPDCNEYFARYSGEYEG
jgi:hypothetical protein